MMTVKIIEEAIQAKDTQKLLNLLSLITEGLHQITRVAPQDATKSVDVDTDLKKRVTVLTLDYMKRNGELGKQKFLSDILIPALGVHKTFADCTSEDLRKIEAKLLEEQQHA